MENPSTPIKWNQILSEVLSLEKSIAEMSAECIKVKRRRDLQKSFIIQMGSSSREDA